MYICLNRIEKNAFEVPLSSPSSRLVAAAAWLDGEGARICPERASHTMRVERKFYTKVASTHVFPHNWIELKTNNARAAPLAITSLIKQ